jgi:hypothetical protein
MNSNGQQRSSVREALDTALKEIPEKLPSKLKPYREKSPAAVRTVKKDLRGKEAEWLTRESAPDGFGFDLPTGPFRIFELITDGRDVGVQAPPPAVYKRAREVFKEVYKPAARRYTNPSNPLSVLPNIRSEKEAVAEEQERYEDLLTTEREEARKVLNVWMQVLVEENGLTFDSSLHDSACDRPGPHFGFFRPNMWSWDFFGDLTFTTQDLLESAAEDFSLSQVARYERHSLWSAVMRGSATLCSKLEVLGSFFEVPEAVTRSASVGLLYHAREIKKLEDPILFLAAKRAAFEAIQHVLVFDQEPASWEEVREAPTVDGREKHTHRREWIVERYSALEGQFSSASATYKQVQEDFSARFDVPLDDAPDESTIRRYLGRK